jgi:hypothetical protein
LFFWALLLRWAKEEQRMFHTLKRALLPVALLAVILGASVSLPVPAAHADLTDGVWFLDDFSPGTADDCDEGDPRLVRVFDEENAANEQSMITAADGIDDQDPVVQLGIDDELILCVEPASADANVTFTTSGSGTWDDAHCGDLDTNCVDEEGVGSDVLTVVDSTNDTSFIALTFSCEAASVQTISIIQDDTDDEFQFIIMCKGEASSMSLTARPGTVIESSPAIGNTAHALIRAVITDAAGNPVLPGTEVDFETSRCALSAGIDTLAERDQAMLLFGELPLVPPADEELHEFANTFPLSGLMVSTPTIEVDTNVPTDGVPNHSEALIILHAEGCAPGSVTITARIEREDLADLEATVTITVVGPVSAITIAASPTTLVCGEKSEITITARDAAGQNVSEHTRLEVVTNYGGVLAGTGSSLTVQQPVNPLSSTTVEIVGGRARAFLLTSTRHVGAYEVLAASVLSPLGGDLNLQAPAVAQVTVTCTRAVSPTVTAPSTGTGSIRPPSTGDGGLADTGGASLLVIGGAGVLALGTFARMRRTHG